ncbi:MAG: HAD family phosphatase, partial [bacterium]
DSIFNEVNRKWSFGVKDIKLPIREKRRYFVSLLGKGIDLLPGIKQLLDYASNKLYIGLGSSSSKSNVDKILDITGIRSYFNAVVTAEDVCSYKPDPETYQKVLAGLGLKGSGCVVLEDTGLGMQAGKNSGMTVVGVKTGKYETNFDYADIVVDNVEKGFYDIIRIIEE